MAFSPLGKNLLIFQKPQGQQKNLTLRFENRIIVLYKHHNALSKASRWLRSSLDCSVCCTRLICFHDPRIAMSFSSGGSVFLYIRPVIQFTDDEIVGCRLVTSEAHIFGGRDLSKGTIHRFRLPGINGVQLAHIYLLHILLHTYLRVLKPMYAYSDLHMLVKLYSY